MPKKTLTGNVYGDIKAIEYIGNSRYKCQCINCGVLSEQYSTNLKGDIHCQKCGKAYRVDLTGNQYGFLTVKEYNRDTKKWVCECKCGRKIEVKSNNLKHNNTMSCGKCKYIEAVQQRIIGGTNINQINKTVSKRNTSGIVGVGYNRRRNKWYAAIQFCGKKYFLGNYDKKEDAASVRKTAESRLHGDFLQWLKEEFPEQYEKLSKKTNLTRGIQ